MNNKELFTHKSDDYANFRPSYPLTAIAWLREKISGEQVVDIGAGTGIFTQLLRHKFQQISAVEPNGDMRKKFMQLLPDIPCSAASGEATLYPENSVDLITVAQAFHWLDEEKFKAEAMRILRPGGKVAIVWNTSVPDDFVSARNAVCQKYCPRFRSGHAGKRTPAEGDAFLRNSYFREVEVVSFANPFIMDLETFEGNIRSRSYALTPQDEQYEDFTAELRTVFEQYSQKGFVTEPQETQIYLGSF
ncbi:MAG: class I SAM-dependent methyltransferase [Lentisphaerae bacterium]|nr:class I SAM-dependent methyltransferase [Lentisphaerota bacterium]